MRSKAAPPLDLRRICLAWLWLLAFFETGLMESLSSGDSTAEALPPCEAPVADPLVCVNPEAPDRDADYWRQEVATRLQRYRARRKPRGPRYPSLRLPFDSWTSSETGHAGRPTPALPHSPAVSSMSSTLAAQDFAFELRQPDAATPAADSYRPEPEPDYSAKIIEFPRSAAIPVGHREELAEPVFERPRIVEAPEVVPPPPALGGILIEPAPVTETRARAAEVLPNSASLARRILAGALDALILIVALVAFAAIFVRLNPELAPKPLLAAALAVTAAILLAGYEFLFLVYTGSTPGLRLARLRLTKFDGSHVPRRLRRWRVLASYLSACSLGLGYLWSFLDSDGLCWHDRITRTHFQ